MLDDIIYAAGCILMAVEAVAIIFLLWAWRDAKRKQAEAVRKNPPFAREMMPMGAVTYAIACSHCKNRGPEDKSAADRCHRCMCEIESGFEVDPATFMYWIPVTERLPEESGQYIVCCDDSGCPYGEGIWYRSGVVVCAEVEVFGGIYWEWHDYDLEGIVTHWMPLPETPKEE